VLKLFWIIKVRPWTIPVRYRLPYLPERDGGARQNADGQDATNDISYMVLETIRSTRLTQPQCLGPRALQKTDRFLMECATNHPAGVWDPAIKNDEIICRRCSRKVLRRWMPTLRHRGCIEPQCPANGYRVTGIRS